MSDNNPVPFPMDLSGFRDVPAGEVAPLLERAAEAFEKEAIPVLTALLRNRILRLLRQGSRQEILDEAMMLNRFLAMETGARLHKREAEAYGRWSALGELLSTASRSTSRAAIPSILLGTQGHGMAILQLLAAEGGRLPRAEIRRRRGLPEAHLSHLLRDLEEADLIVRYRPERSKEVFVELGPAAQDVVPQPSTAPASIDAPAPESRKVLTFRKADQVRFEEVTDLPDGQSLRSLLAPVS
jgi:DNA-binding MarR family transcriptional regulator